MPNNPVDTSGMTRVAPTPQLPFPNPNPSADPGFNPLSIAPIPPVMGTAADAARQFYRIGVSQLRMPPLPSQASPSAGSQIQSQKTNLVQEVMAAAPETFQINGSPTPGSTANFNSTYPAISASDAPVIFQDDNGKPTTDVSAYVAPFGASGTHHAPGAVPDPGSSAGTTRFLREDATWDVPSGGGSNYQTVQENGASLPQEAKLNILSPLTAVDNSGNGSSDVGISVFGASGSSHSTGAVPDPGSTAGTGRYLREDATFDLPDGLIHGEVPWGSDPSAIVLQDDFISGDVTDSVIGALGWNFSQAGGSVGAVYNNVGGPFPYYGEIAIAANASGTANSGYVLTLNGYNGARNGGTFSPFVANPSWKMVWVFRFMPNLGNDPTAGFDLTNRAMYIGLGVPISENTTFAQRPYNFVGLRFDQDTTAPTINDSTFKFEVLQNGPVNAVSTRTSSNGVNNQGGATFSITSVSCTSNVITVTAANTLQVNSMVTFSAMTTSTFLNGITANVISANSTSFTINFTHANFTATTETGTATLGGSVTDTSMTPTIGKYYRFEMSCSTAGEVIMSLSDGSTTYSASNLVVPQYVFNVVSGWTFANEYTGEFKVQGGSGNGPICPFGTGSVLTFSGFTSTAAAYNGSQTVFNNGGTLLQFLTGTSTGTLSNQTGTIAGYPSHLIQASFGTTTSGSGTDKCALHIDFFGFAWSPAVNGGSGTPNSVKPRYW